MGRVSSSVKLSGERTSFALVEPLGIVPFSEMIFPGWMVMDFSGVRCFLSFSRYQVRVCGWLE